MGNTIVVVEQVGLFLSSIVEGSSQCRTNRCARDASNFRFQLPLRLPLRLVRALSTAMRSSSSRRNVSGRFAKRLGLPPELPSSIYVLHIYLIYVLHIYTYIYVLHIYLLAMFHISSLDMFYE